MPNVDLCVRYSQKAICIDINKYSELIEELDNSIKTNLLKNKDKEEIKDILSRSKNSILVQIRNDYYRGKKNLNKIILFEGSNDNKKGADINHRLENGELIDIELKFGQETDRNIGMKQFEKIFSTTIFSKALDIKKRKIWKELSLIEYPKISAQEDRLKNELNNPVDLFNKYIKNKNYTLSKNEQNFMENFIINNTGDGESKPKYYMKFLLEENQTNNMKLMPTKIGSWEIINVKKLDNKIKRVNIFTINRTTNLQIKYTLNWKNNYKLSNDKKVSAKLGIGSPSWNVWIDVEITHLNS